MTQEERERQRERESRPAWVYIIKEKLCCKLEIFYKERTRPKFKHRQTLETNPGDYNPDKQSYPKFNP